MTQQAPRRISVVTGTRADYWLLRPLLLRLRDEPRVTLEVMATGAHLQARFGSTLDDILSDGFAPRRVPILEQGEEGKEREDGPVAIARAVGRGIAGFAEAWSEERPDLVVVLGDRYEILAAAQAALLLRLPLAHLFGGEVTQGALDEQIRHAVTKFAQIHLVACETYRRRVIQLGESPDRVFVVGATGVSAALSLDPMSEAQLSADLGVPLKSPLFLVTWHPETLGEDDGVQAMIAALEAMPEARVVITGVNADPGHEEVWRQCRAFAARHSDRVTLHASLGQRRYLSVMRLADAVVGNSSSGVIEAPAMRIPTVNIGGRQAGRLRSASVIDCPAEQSAIAAALRKSLDPAFRRAVQDQTLPFPPCDHDLMARVLMETSLDGIVRKVFHDA